MRSPTLGVVLLLALAAAARAADEVVTDAWFAQFHGDTKAGWSHHRRVHTTLDGKPAWISETQSLLIRSAGGEMLKAPIRSSTRFVEDDSGNVLSYATSIDIGIGNGPQTREGKVAGGAISAVEDGKPRTLPYPVGALGPAAIDRAIAADLQPGATGGATEFRAIDPAGSGPVTWKVYGTTEQTNVMGRHLWLNRVEKMDDSHIADTVLIDGAGHVFGGGTSFGLHQWFLTEETVAKTDAQPASLLTSRVVSADRTIDGRPARTVLRLARKAGAVKDLPEGAGQRIAARGKDGSIDVEVSSVDPPAGLVPLPRPYAGRKDMKRYLAATPLVELENARLREFAGTAVGELVNSLRAARMIELFVHANFEPAPADIGFGTACDAISGAKGDSTETAVLAAAYARASGLPSRLVAGFVHWPANAWSGTSHPHGAFAFHAWTEVYVGEDTWFPIDPMRMDGTEPRTSVDELAGHGGFDATHVAVSKSDLATNRPVTEIVLPVLEFMDGLSIEVIEPKAGDAK